MFRAYGGNESRGVSIAAHEIQLVAVQVRDDVAHVRLLAHYACNALHQGTERDAVDCHWSPQGDRNNLGLSPGQDLLDERIHL